VNNPTGWANPEYDRLLNQANTEPNPTVRMQLLARAEEVLLKDLPIIPIYSSAVSLLTKPYVRGWTANVLDRHPLKFVWVEKASTD
jgi:oligopeptide transport system substrate-binding protein